MSVEKGRIDRGDRCFNCHKEIQINQPQVPAVDFFKVVCSRCGAINHVSTIARVTTE